MIVHVLQGLLAIAAAALGHSFLGDARKRGERLATDARSIGVGAVTNFFDTLGIGSFAPTTALIKFFRLIDDINIPGTLNVGHSIPTIAQAIIFIAIVKVDLSLPVACIWASVFLSPHHFLRCAISASFPAAARR